MVATPLPQDGGLDEKGLFIKTDNEHLITVVYIGIFLLEH